MNFLAIKAIYRFEMARALRTFWQSIFSPVITTSLYFIVFGAAMCSRIGDISDVSYGAFIVPGLLMMSLLGQSVSNASFGIYMPRWNGSVYEILSAPVTAIEIILGYVGAAASKSLILAILILITARVFVDYEIQHPVWMIAFLLLTTNGMRIKRVAITTDPGINRYQIFSLVFSSVSRYFISSLWNL